MHALRLRNRYSDAEIVCLPMSDGGEGMVECIAEAVDAVRVNVSVHDPLMQMIEAHKCGFRRQNHRLHGNGGSNGQVSRPLSCNNTSNNAKCQKHQMNMESGKKPLLDDYHESMAENINSDFDTLYSTLIKYYNATLDSLENVSAIMNLRKSHYESTGFMLLFAVLKIQ